MLHVHRSERADGLAGALSALLADPLPDPFAAEVVVVPTRGMERWLTQFMSARLGAAAGRGDGVCANVEFPSPRVLVGDAVAAACGIDAESDPWRPERAVWPLLEVVDAGAAEPWLRALAEHLRGGAGRRFATARHLAGLFDRYALHRPDMVRAWRDGRDVDATGAPLPPAAVWQAELWRRLAARIAEDDPARRLADAGRVLAEDPQVLALPSRVSLFGLTRLPAGDLEILSALARGRDVHLFVLHPSPGLWETVDRHPLPPASRRRADDPTAVAARNRLLASWGQDVRELQLVLAAAGDAREHHHATEAGGDSLLRRVQADVRADRTPPGIPAPGTDDGRPLLHAADRSIEVHACHGRARQVEVLRDAVLHALAADPGLEPRDIVVMCPDIEAFAPLIHATFGAGDALADADPDGGDGRLPDLRVRLADRALRQVNPVLAVLAELLDLADQRMTASQVLGLADREPVRRRFGLDDDALGRLQSWAGASGVRWGLDAASREPFKLEDLELGTWRAGLDRLLAGVAMTEEELRLVGGVLPLDDVDSGEIELVGRLVELVDRLRAATATLRARKPIDAWADSLATAADALTATAPRDAWQRAQLQRILDEVAAEAAGSGAEVSLPEIRALLGERLAGRPTRANFRTGHLTICTLVPMRSVPHRVVCLLGLDDGAFPRRSSHDGDDLVLADPQLGDRDGRAEDRQLLLDALMAAGDRLVITYTGNDERTNVERPPAVPVGELLDAVDATVRTGDGSPARDAVVVRHPLQPFDQRNFIAGRLAGDGPWSFDPVSLGGARALDGVRTPPRAFLAQRLPAADTAIVEVDELVRFVGHPVRAFLRQRLGFGVGDFEDELADDLEVELDGLGRYQVGQRMLEARLAGIDDQTVKLAEIRRGSLPPGVLGKPVIDEVRPIVDALVRATETIVPRAAERTSVDVRVELAGGGTLGGTVAGLAGDVLLAVNYSRLAAKHRLAAWVRFLALTAAHPERACEAVTIGRGGVDVAVARIRAFPGDAQARRERALAELAVLTDLRARGLREPLPVYCASSAAYAEGVARGRNATEEARNRWKSDFNFPKEDAEPEHQLVLGGVVDFDDLLAVPPAADESGPGWEEGEPHRFGRLARRLWAGLLDREELS